MMKRIFVGSSKEGLDQAEKVAEILSDVDNVEPVLWTDVFSVGDITFLGIEKVASEVAGAVFLATPDDDSVIRDTAARVPRANVLFEYGYLTARLSRPRVALCRFDNVELPSDFSGLTYVPMGAFDANKAIDPHARSNLKSWAASLPKVQAGIPPVAQLHGYSGLWTNETIFDVWRDLKIEQPNFAIFKGTMILHLNLDGQNGAGSFFGTLRVKIDDCYAEFEISDRVISAIVLPDGSIRLRSVLHSRQRTMLQNTPPQQYGFEKQLYGADEYESVVRCDQDQLARLIGEYTTRIGDRVTSHAKEYYERIDPLPMLDGT